MKRIELIELCFFLPASPVDRSIAEKFLQTLRIQFPEATPTRFGPFEPFQSKLETGNDEPFIEEWLRQGHSELGGYFFWKAKPPSYGGSVFFSHQRPALFRNLPERYACRHVVSLRFDGSKSKHQEWNHLVDLFCTLARSLNAFYAAAFVTRNVIAKANSIAYDGESELFYLQRSQWWLGLPSKPTWLTWFAHPYYQLLQEALHNNEFAHDIDSNAILIRMAENPMNQDELRDLYPKLPQELLQTGDDDPQCAKTIPVI